MADVTSFVTGMFWLPTTASKKKKTGVMEGKAGE